MPTAITDTGGLARWLAWLRDGTAFLLDQAGRLGRDDFPAPSLLPGWTRAHVLTHVARNADALSNLVTWARTGVETPMYADSAQRDRDIQAGAVRPADELCRDVHVSAQRLAAAIFGLPVTAWAVTVRSARGRQIPAAEIPWLRAREVWVHAIDLGAGARFTDLPPALVDELLDDVAASLSARPECPAISLEPTDRPYSRPVGEGAHRTPVTADAADLLGWLIGRSAGHGLRPGTGLPRIPPWL